jgi:hypothetical protein
MISELINDLDYLSLNYDEVGEDGDSYKAVVRVKDKHAWSALVQDLLLDADEEDEFGVSIRKEYYLHPDTKKPQFCWVILVWGNLEEAFSAMEASLKKRRGKVKPPKGVSVVDPRRMGQNPPAEPRPRVEQEVSVTVVSKEAQASDPFRMKRKRRRSPDGFIIEETHVPLPHRHGPRYTSTNMNEVTGLGHKGFGAAVSTGTEGPNVSSWYK